MRWIVLLLLLALFLLALPVVFLADFSGAPPSVRPSVTILTPQDGESVPVAVLVRGESRTVAPGVSGQFDPPWLYVIVLPNAGDPAQSWWVQNPVVVDADGSWAARAFVGLGSDDPDTPYVICAIVSDEVLKPGRFGEEAPPALSRECVSVAR